MIRILISVLSLLAIHSAAAAETEHTFYVAPPPIGDDSGSGTQAKPFATLNRARLAVREYRANQPARGEIVVEFKSGQYELASPVRFEAADSGQPGKEVVYRAERGGAVVLSGGRRVTGWKADSSGMYAAEVGTEVDFRQLWVNGRRGVRARRPNRGEFFSMAADKKQDGFDLPGAHFANLAVRPAEVELSVLIAWMHKRLRVARVDLDAAGETVRAVIEAPEWDAVTNQPQGDRVYAKRRYWLENAIEFLDAPGEFHLDRSTGILHYKPRPGETVERLEAVRPLLEHLIVLEGRFEAPVHDLRFEGITFAHTGWTRPNRSGFVDVQANSLVPANPAAAADPQYRHGQRKDRVPAAFHAITSDRVVVRGCRFVQLGGTGLMLTGGGNENVIEGNSFYDLAGGGIEIGEDAAKPEDERLIPRRNRVANNFIARIGEDYWGSVAILGYYTDSLDITRNEIAAVPYTAVSQGWGWGNPPAPEGSRANKITLNKVSNYMRRLDDGGGIYTTDRLLNSEIAYNVIERMLPPDVDTKAGGALYLDQFTEGVHVHHNVVTEAVRWLFIWNANIRGNRVEANFADTAAQRNDGTDNHVEPVHVFEAGEMPLTAKEVYDRAGIAEEFSGAREYTVSSELILENVDPEFHFKGEWRTAFVANTYSATVKSTSASDAVARVWPVLPRPGTYQVSVWQPDPTSNARFAIRHAGGETKVTLEPSAPAKATGSASWRSLGQFAFEAGIGTELTISGTGASGGPVTVDAIRFTRVGD